MKLSELSGGYLSTALLLRARLRELRLALRAAETPQQRAALRHSIAMLSEIQTQCYELASLTAHYYERGFYRSEKYTL